MSFLSLIVSENARSALKPTATTVTSIDGSKRVFEKDGSIRPLPSETTDQNSAWAVMDEMASTGVDGGGPGAEPAPDEGGSTYHTGIGTLDQLIANDPQLRDYVLMLEQDGLPLNVVRARVAGEFGQATAARFVDAINNTDPASLAATGALAEDQGILHGEPSELHGHLGNPEWAAPRLVTRCGEIARPGYNSGRAHEYLDTPEVLREKVKVLANLFRAAKKPVLYAGAGLSTSAGINDYATRAGSESLTCKTKNVSNVNHTGSGSGSGGSCGAGKVLSPYCARPSAGHHVIAALANKGYVWRFIQQNHDGLPQKAGVPQHIMNEIHGAWFDPSNPVVAMSGQLRGDLFADLLKCEREADLVLAIGTSLSGMNADRLVSTVARKARSSNYKAKRRSLLDPAAWRKDKQGSAPRNASIGSVIVSLQRTPHDANSSLRIYALIDDVMSMLAEELGVEVVPYANATVATEDAVHQPHDRITSLVGSKKMDVDMFRVPYDADGRRTQELRVLDLREGARVKLTDGPNKDEFATVMGRNADGHWRVRITHEFNQPSSQPGQAGYVRQAKLATFGEVRLLGSWWPLAAAKGEVDSIPVVTITEEKAEHAAASQADPAADADSEGFSSGEESDEGDDERPLTKGELEQKMRDLL